MTLLIVHVFPCEVNALADGYRRQGKQGNPGMGNADRLGDAEQTSGAESRVLVRGGRKRMAPACDPCAKQLATSVLAWHRLAVNVLVEGVCDRTRRLETPPIYVRIVKVVGSRISRAKPIWEPNGG